MATESTPRASRMPRVVRAVVILFLGGLVLVLVGCLLTWSHYRHLPTFGEWLRTARSDDALAADRSGGRIVSRDGRWIIHGPGAADPSSAASPDTLTFSLRLQHGEDLLLDWTQAVRLTYAEGSLDRTSVEVAPETLVTHPDMRLRGRLLLTDAEGLAGPGSMGVGHVKLEAWLLSGAGPSEVEVVLADELPARELEPGVAPSMDFTNVLDPFPDPFVPVAAPLQWCATFP